MELYSINTGLTPIEKRSPSDACVLALLTSEELERGEPIPGLENVLRHIPAARDAHVCKAESRRNCLCGTIVTPRYTKKRTPIAFGYLLEPGWVILCDDSGAVASMLQHLRKNEPRREAGPGGFFYDFLELLIAKDLHHLQSLEDQLEQLEDQVLSGNMEAFNQRMTALRKEIARWIRYYTQLDDMICELQENENGYFSDGELRMFHMAEKRVGRLNGEAKAIREYGLQLRELFQSEIDVRQNRVMKILTIVTTVFLPLTLVTGWYGMNFVNMPELTWKYGYPTVIGVSVLIVSVCLWIMKRKKFW